METTTTTDNAAVNFLEAATQLIDRGISVIPLMPKGKRPVAGIGAGQRTREMDVIRQWAVQYPDSNVAAVADHDVLILESDDWARLAPMLGELPVTLKACGSSEDRPHYYFRQTSASMNVGNLVVPGLFELRSSYQYVVAPPSIHPDGMAYRWLVDVPIVPIPQWLVSRLVEIAQQRQRERKNPAVAGEVFHEGTRHYAIMSEAGRLWDGEISEDDLIARMLDFNEERCLPPKDQPHVIACVRDVMRLEPNRPAPRCIVGSSQPHPEKPTVERPFPKLSVLLAAAKKADQTPFLIPRFLPANIPSILPGDSGLGKTPLVAQMAVALALGQDFLTREPLERRKVLIVDYESGGQLLSMLETFAAFFGQPSGELDDWLYVIDGHEWTQQRILSAADEWRVDLAIVDALRGLSPQAESKNADAAALLADLQRQGAAWLLVHHLRKNPADERAKRPDLDKDDVKVMAWLDAVAGARALVNQAHTRLAIDHAHTGQADLIIRPYVKQQGETGRIYLSRLFDEDGEPRGYERTVGQELLSLNRKHHFRLVEGQKLTFSEVMARLSVSRSNTKAFIDDCAQAGLVQRQGDSRASKGARAQYVFAKPPEHPEHLLDGRRCSGEKAGVLVGGK
jgi:hypothetical protein